MLIRKFFLSVHSTFNLTKKSDMKLVVTIVCRHFSWGDRCWRRKGKWVWKCCRSSCCTVRLQKFQSNSKKKWQTVFMMLNKRVEVFCCPKDVKTFIRKRHKLNFPESMKNFLPQFPYSKKENQSIGKQIHHLEEILSVSSNQHVWIQAIQFSGMY